MRLIFEHWNSIFMRLNHQKIVRNINWQNSSKFKLIYGKNNVQLYIGHFILDFWNWRGIFRMKFSKIRTVINIVLFGFINDWYFWFHWDNLSCIWIIFAYPTNLNIWSFLQLVKEWISNRTKCLFLLADKSHRSVRYT